MNEVSRQIFLNLKNQILFPNFQSAVIRLSVKGTSNSKVKVSKTSKWNIFNVAVKAFGEPFWSTVGTLRASSHSLTWEDVLSYEDAFVGYENSDLIGTALASGLMSDVCERAKSFAEQKIEAVVFMSNDQKEPND